MKNVLYWPEGFKLSYTKSIMVQQSLSAIAQTLVDALPYIRRFSGQYICIKYGGSVMVDEALKQAFALGVNLCRYVGMKPVIVHGGGKEISKWMSKVGKKAVFIDGQRFTDDETMELAEMVISGKVNNDIVAELNKNGAKAIGLSGKSANLFTAARVEATQKVDLGRVGRILSVDPELIHNLTQQGYIPVISPVSSDKLGHSLNLNADNVASYVAQSLKAKKLIYLTDVDGLMIDGTLKKKMGVSEAKQLLAHQDVSGGMIPKLNFSIQAIEGGVHQVHMVNGHTEHAVLLEILTKGGVGTLIEA